MKKVGNALASIIVSALTVAVLLLCILFGRLFFGPIDVGFARDEVTARAAALLPGWDVQFNEASVGWDWASVRPWLILEDTTLIDRRDRLSAQFPHVEIGLGFRGILAGIGVSTISIDRANINVIDIGGFSDATDDSLFADLFGDSGIPKPEIFLPLTEAFNRFSLRLLNTLPEIERINFDGMSVRIFRGENLNDATLSLSNFDLAHSDQDLNLSSQIDVAIGSSSISTRLRGRARPVDGDLSIVFGLNDFYPSSIAKNEGLPEFLQYIQLPLDLSLELDLDAKTGLQSAELGGVIGMGQLSDPLLFPENPAINYGVISGRYDAVERTLVVDELNLSTESGDVEGEGLVYWQNGQDDPGIRLSLKSSMLAIESILKYWPKRFHSDGRERGARAWVSQHIIKGNTENVEFSVDMSPAGEGAFLNKSPYRLTFDFSSLDTLFLKTMPPIMNASGQAELTVEQMTIDLTQGDLMGMPVAGSSVLLENIHIPLGGTGNFEIYTRGDVQTLMRLIDNPPLLVAQKAKLDIERLGGQATVKANVKAPLLRAVESESVEFDVSAQLTDVSVEDLLDGEGLSSAQLSLTVNSDNLSAAGQGLLNGVPVNLRWSEDFSKGRSDSAADTTLIVLNAALDEHDLKKLNVDISDYLRGSVQAEASFEGRNFQFTHGTFAADASSAVLKIDPLSWSKPVGSTANITGNIIFDDGRTNIEPLVVVGEDVDLEFKLQLGQAGEGSFSAQVAARRIGNNSLTAQLNQVEGQPLNVNVQASRFDFAPYLQNDTQSKITEVEISDALGDPQGIDFDLKLNAQEFLLLNGERWHDVAVDLSFAGNAPKSLLLKANAKPQDQPLTVSVDGAINEETGRRGLTASAVNGGQILRAFGLFSHIDGGALKLSGETVGWGADWDVSGRLEVSDSLLYRSTDLSEAVTKGTVPAIDTYLPDGALELDILDAPFEYKDEILTINNLKTNGPSMGLTMEGQIAATDGIMNINGVVVPAYGINSLLGNIPLVGSIFTGGDGKGLFGVAYRVKGSTDAPDVSVSALSGLAPGFLRLLFEGQKGRVADVEMPAKTEHPVPEDTDIPDDEEGLR